LQLLIAVTFAHITLAGSFPGQLSGEDLKNINLKLAGNITAGYNLIFTICGITYLTAWIIIHLLTRKIKPLENI
jgi:uncharacterized membrane protein YciS (DUF1049 family)